MSWSKESSILLLLLIFVLVANYPALHYGMIHFEQVPLYFANQFIVSWRFLLDIYLHPQLFYAGSIPYFRPSGLFLMYQLLAPIVGWHNIKAFIVVNFIFLTLSGYVVVKLYELLFPKLKLGGYLGFALYVMHPALIFPRLMVIQFDYSYVLFSVLSVYLFVLFCQKNKKRQGYLFLLSSLFAYAIAVTFKETAIMTTFALACYLVLFHQRDLLRCSKMLYALLLLAGCTIGCFIYLSVNDVDIFKWSYILFKLGNNIPYYVTLIQGLWSPEGDTYWSYRDIVIPVLAQYLLVFSFLCFFTAMFGIDKKYRKSLYFLLAVTGIFFIFPLFLGAAPWHLSLSLLFLTMVLGFSLDTMCISYAKPLLFLASGLAAILVLQANIDNSKNSIYAFALKLNRNAILHPPLIHDLQPDSVLLVQDSRPLGAYLLGSSQYPILPIIGPQDKNARVYFIRNQGFYNGMLFRMAYQMPALREEVYPFRMNKMQEVPKEIFDNWWLNAEKIHCVGYDNFANWHDLTAEFQANLLREHARRWISL